MSIDCVLVIARCTVDLKESLQPDDIGVNEDYDDYLEHYNSTLCLRSCKSGEPPRVCYYKFNIENYNTIGRLVLYCSFFKRELYDIIYAQGTC